MNDFGGRRRIDGPDPPSGARDHPGSGSRSRPVARARRPRDRPLDRPPAAAHLQRRAAGRAGRGRGRHHPHGRGRPLCGPGVRPAPRGGGEHPGRPQQRRHRGGHRRRRARAAGPGPQRRRRGRARRWHCSSPPPGACVGADRDVRAGEIYKDGTIPYQRFRAWQLAGRTAGLVGPRSRGARPAVAPRGPRHERRRLRPLRGRCHPHASSSSSRCPTWCRCTPRSPRRRRG